MDSLRSSRLIPRAPTMSSITNETPVIRPRQTMRGHTKSVRDVVHLPDGQHIMNVRMTAHSD